MQQVDLEEFYTQSDFGTTPFTDKLQTIAELLGNILTLQ
jgi:hypothetical protein